MTSVAATIYKGKGDEQDRFRVEWQAETDEATRQAFLSTYGEENPACIPVHLPRFVWDAWELVYEAYYKGKCVARADAKKYLEMVDCSTGEYVIQNGKPYRPMIPNESIPCDNGKFVRLSPIVCLKMKLPDMQPPAMVELKVSSICDTLTLAHCLAGTQLSADTVGLGEDAPVPGILYLSQGGVGGRAETWQLVQPPKLLVCLSPDLGLDAGNVFTAHLKSLSAIEANEKLSATDTYPKIAPPDTISLASEPDIRNSESLLPAQTLSIADPVPTRIKLDDFCPLNPGDWKHYWMVAVDALIEFELQRTGDEFAGHRVKVQAHLCRKQSENDARQAYRDLLRYVLVMVSLDEQKNNTGS